MAELNNFMNNETIYFTYIIFKLVNSVHTFMVFNLDINHASLNYSYELLKKQYFKSSRVLFLSIIILSFKCHVVTLN